MCLISYLNNQVDLTATGTSTSRDEKNLHVKVSSNTAWDTYAYVLVSPEVEDLGNKFFAMYLLVLARG